MTAKATPARFSVNVYATTDIDAAAVREAVEALGATYERGFGRWDKAQMMFTNGGATLASVRTAATGAAPEGATVKVSGLRG